MYIILLKPDFSIPTNNNVQMIFFFFAGGGGGSWLRNDESD